MSHVTCLWNNCLLFTTRVLFWKYLYWWKMPTFEIIFFWQKIKPVFFYTACYYTYYVSRFSHKNHYFFYVCSTNLLRLISADKFYVKVESNDCMQVVLHDHVEFVVCYSLSILFLWFLWLKHQREKERLWNHSTEKNVHAKRQHFQKVSWKHLSLECIKKLTDYQIQCQESMMFVQ